MIPTYQTKVWTLWSLLLLAHLTPHLSSLSNLRDLLPSRCNLGESFCEGTCNAIGRTGGKCLEKDGVQDCQCDETFLTGSQFALCGAESTCRLDCQRRGSVSPLTSYITNLSTYNIS